MSQRYNVDTTRLDGFLRSVERRALGMARIAVGHEHEALDLVQESMLAFASRYAMKPEEQWRPLFHRILQNKIKDWYRRGAVQGRLFSRLSPAGDEDGRADPWQSVPDPKESGPERMAQSNDAARALNAALADLPRKQQQVFLLRAWEGLSTAETARAMGCSQGSVKTHYSRAMSALRGKLEDHWP